MRCVPLVADFQNGDQLQQRVVRDGSDVTFSCEIPAAASCAVSGFSIRADFASILRFWDLLRDSVCENRKSRRRRRRGDLAAVFASPLPPLRTGSRFSGRLTVH